MDRTMTEKAEARERTAGRRVWFEGAARRYYAGVYNYLRWLCRDVALAEDLTQETFTRLWQHPPERRGEHPLRAWIYRVARNEYLQHRRRAGLETVALEECAEVADETMPPPEVKLAREALGQAVRAAVEKLPDLYREVVVLHNLEDLPLAQVALVLEIPVGTVKSRRAKAFVALRTLLAEQETAR